MSGKRIRGAKYVHVSNTGALTELEQQRLIKAEALAKVQRGEDFNVVKIVGKGEVVSLLRYSRFFDEAFPVLVATWTLDLADGTVRQRSYDEFANPPILHRKELLLERSHPRFLEYQALTFAVKNAGLFDEPAKIGFKSQWYRKLEQAGLRVEGHELVSAS